MINYLWRVIMIDNTGEENATSVALFLLEGDARKWAAQENKNEPDVNYSVLPPKKSLT